MKITIELEIQDGLVSSRSMYRLIVGTALAQRGLDADILSAPQALSWVPVACIAPNYESKITITPLSHGVMLANKE